MSPAQFIELIALGLVVWRVAYMVTSENGPFAIFLRLRALVTRAYEGHSKEGTLYELFTCPYCLSVWLAFLAAFYVQRPTILTFYVNWLAIAGVAAVIQRWAGFDFKQ